MLKRNAVVEELEGGEHQSKLLTRSLLLIPIPILVSMWLGPPMLQPASGSNVTGSAISIPC